MTDTELIGRILSGEEQLFGELVKRYAGCVWAVCSSHIFNRGDCEDVAQDVFIQCYLRLHTIRRPGAFGRWLRQTARRSCLQWLRAASRRRAAMTRYEEHVENVQPGAETEDLVSRREIQQSVLTLVNALPPKTREALLLCYSEGYSATEAAGILGVSPDAVIKRLRYGRKLLQEKVGHELEPALASRRHEEAFTRAAMAAIPFGKAPWLGTAGAVAATGATAVSKSTIIGGIAIMSKKIALSIGAILVVLAVTYSLTLGSGTDVDEEQVREFANPVVTSGPGAEHAAAGSTPRAAPAEQPSAPVAAAIPKDAEPTLPDPEPEAVQPASISGYVRDSSGFAVANASILIEIVRGDDRNDIAKAYDARTGADGHYEIEGVDAFGRALVYASADGCTMERNSLRVRAGTQHSDVDFTLYKTAFLVAGRVVTESGKPVPGASVESLYYGYNEKGLAYTAETGGTTGSISSTKFVFAAADEDGYFEIGIPAEGLCDFRVLKDGFGPGFFPQIMTGTVDAVFVLRSGGTIAGRVTRAGGEPVDGVAVKVSGEVLPGGLTPSAVAIQPLPCMTVTVTTDSQGAYRAEGLGEDYVYAVLVPRSGLDDAVQLPVEKGVRTIANMMAEFAGRGLSLAAEKRGVRVTAGHTTSGVDLVLGSSTAATVHGVVEDRTTGKPACPVAVIVEIADPSGADDARLGGATGTTLDGSYTMQTGELSETRTFRVRYRFMTEGGSAWQQPEDDVALLELGPGDDEALDFAIDAPIEVPVRYVDSRGDPLEGIRAAMRSAGGRGGCGGTLISDAEGRVTFHGIAPFVSLEALAWSGGGSSAEIGVSEPFSGQPGETVPEVVVVCHSRGGVEGIVVAADGSPVANTGIACYAVLPGGTLMEGRLETMTNAEGAFCLLDVLREGMYPRVLVGYGDMEANDIYGGYVDDVEIGGDAITDLGRIATKPLTLAEGMALMGVEQ